MSDDYEPALEMDATPDETPAAPVTAPTPVEIPQQARDNPDEGGPRAPRVVSDKVRAMFRDLASKVKSGEVTIESEDLVPVEHDTPPPSPQPAVAPPPVAQPVAAVPVPATASPAAQAAAALPVPVPRAQPLLDVGKAEAEQRKLLLEMREKQIADREAKLAEREKRVPTADRLVENPVPTLAEYIKTAYGITDDADLKDTITDLMTEMSETYHGVKLPEEIRARVDSRKAVRSVKAYKAGLDREKADLVARQEAQAKADREAQEKAEVAEYEKRAVAQLTTVLESVETQYPYLVVQESAPSIVWEVMKEALNQGHKLTWDAAAQYANDHYKAEHERSQAEAQRRASRLATLLAPAAPVAPAKPAASPGGAPGPAPKPQPPAAPPQPPATITTDPADDIVGEDRRERRARSLHALRAKHGLGANTAR